MDASQRARALRLADELDPWKGMGYPLGKMTIECAALLRELAAEPVRVPLTKEDIEGMTWMLSADREYEAHTGQEYLVVNGAEEFARAVESAHGITGDAK